MLHWQAIPYYRRRGCGAYLDRAVDAAIDDNRLTSEVAGLRRTEIRTEIADFVRLSLVVISLRLLGIGTTEELTVIDA